MPAARRLRWPMGSKVRGAGSSRGSGYGRARTTALARIAAATVRVGNTYQARSGPRYGAERDGGIQQNRGYDYQPTGRLKATRLSAVLFPVMRFQIILGRSLRTASTRYGKHPRRSR